MMRINNKTTEPCQLIVCIRFFEVHI